MLPVVEAGSKGEGVLHTVEVLSDDRQVAEWGSLAVEWDRQAFV